MTEEQKSFKQIVEYRKEKLEKLISKGVNPYPALFKPTHKSSEVILNFDALNNSSLHLPGRIISIRKMGKASFFNIQDSSGKIQIFIKKDEVGDSEYEVFQLMDIGDIVGIEGIVFRTKVGAVSYTHLTLPTKA